MPINQKKNIKGATGMHTSRRTISQLAVLSPCLDIYKQKGLNSAMCPQVCVCVCVCVCVKSISFKSIWYPLLDNILKIYHTRNKRVNIFLYYFASFSFFHTFFLSTSPPKKIIINISLDQWILIQTKTHPLKVGGRRSHTIRTISQSHKSKVRSIAINWVN